MDGWIGFALILVGSSLLFFAGTLTTFADPLIFVGGVGVMAAGVYFASRSFNNN